MLVLLITLVLVALLWFVLKSIFSAHPRYVSTVIDVGFLVVMVALLARWLGLL